MRHLKVNQYFVHNIAHKCVIFMFAALLLVIPKIVLSEEITAAPDETYSPQQVINIVLNSMQNNASDNEGIATVFRFTSPDNKLVTGPLSRFTK